MTAYFRIIETSLAEQKSMRKIQSRYHTYPFLSCEVNGEQSHFTQYCSLLSDNAMVNLFELRIILKKPLGVSLRKLLDYFYVN